jgi:diguanylate cyclase (GGDEF)-like protein
MPAYPVPENEVERQKALDELHILDGPSDEDLDRLTRVASQMLGLPIALISLVDHDRQWFLSRVGLEAGETGRDVAFCAHAICGDELMVVPDALQDERFRDNPLVRGEPHIRFYAGAPLRTREGHNLGTLCVIGQEPRILSGNENQLLLDLAGLVIQQLEARRRSWCCPLTSLLNRRPFFADAEREFGRARGQAGGLSLLLLDLDGLKELNDRFGRLYGDRVLTRVAGILQQDSRPTDLMARVASDEFAVLMPDTDLPTAAGIADRIGGQIAALAVDPLSLPITASRAVAGRNEVDDSFPALFGRAEAALEQARRQGRDRTVIARSDADRAEPH